MENMNLEQLSKAVILLKLEIARIKKLIEEKDLDVADDVIDDVEISRRKSHKEFVSNDEMKREFGV